MATLVLIAPQLELPWSSSRADDRRYRRILSAGLGLMLVLSVLVTLVKVPELPRAEQEKLPPQLARVMLEKQELPPPPVAPPKSEELPKPKEDKPKETQPAEAAPEPEAPPVPKPVQPPVERRQPPSSEAVEQARARAQNAGLMQFQDDLAEMREMVDTSAVESASAQVAQSAAKTAAVDRAMITSAAKTTSGGINSAKLSSATGAAALSGRATTQVDSKLAAGAGTGGTANKSDATAGRARSEEEIRKVMEQHKGAIYAIYTRALRQNAALQGKLVVKMVIDPNGRIVEATLVSSELGDADLEKKILNRIRLISFPPAQVVRTTLNQTFDFLPQ